MSRKMLIYVLKNLAGWNYFVYFTANSEPLTLLFVKRFLLFIAPALLLAVIMFVSCRQVPPPPTPADIYLTISVENAAGENMLDPAAEGNILDNEIYIVYDEKRYDLNTNYPHPFKFEIGTDIDGAPMLRFGLFQVITRSDTFTIYWGEGTSDEIKFDMSLTKDEAGKTVWHIKTWLNKLLDSDNLWPSNNIHIAIVK
jgi:hypothetical protein